MPPEDNSPSTPQETVPDRPQPVEESPAPVVEVPAETPAPEPTETAPEAAPAPPESVPVPETASTEPPTAQSTPTEPLPPEPEPIAPEPPSSAASTPPAPTSHIRDLLTRARVAIQDRKRKKRDKIMLALTTKNEITNDEVEKLLHVSDATATRYLSALEKEGRIKQVGKTGHGVVYSKI